MPKKDAKTKESRKPRVVFDTKVLISSLILSGKPRELWSEVLEGNIKLITSNELFSEFSKVITRPKFRRYISQSDQAKFHMVLRQQAEVTKIKTHFTEIKQDPNDNAVLETAHSARADYIISGDKHLLNLKKFNDIRIVTINEMLQILMEQR